MIDRLKKHASEIWGCSIKDMESSLRVRELAYARFQAYALLEEQQSFTLKEIADMFGGRHHSSVIHGIETHKNYVGAKKTDRLSVIYQENFAKLRMSMEEVIKDVNSEEILKTTDKLAGLLEKVSAINALPAQAKSRILSLIQESKVTSRAL